MLNYIILNTFTTLSMVKTTLHAYIVHIIIGNAIKYEFQNACRNNCHGNRN